MDSDVQRDGRLLDTVDAKWREDVLPYEDISVPIMELPDPEPDNGNPQETLKEQEMKWNDLALGCIHESTPNKRVCLCQTESVPEHVYYALQNRGPNSYNMHISNENKTTILICASVLNQRGSKFNLSTQPLVIDESVLAFNGEIFDGIDIPEADSDTTVLFNILSHSVTDVDIVNSISKIKGPWAFSFWCKKTKRLWFGRDILGRRSLVWKRVTTENCSYLQISSVTDSGTDWLEVPTSGIFCLKISSDADSSLICYKWDKTPSGLITDQSACISNEFETLTICENFIKIQSPIEKNFNTFCPESKLDLTVAKYISKLYNLKNSEIFSSLNLKKILSSDDNVKILSGLIESEAFTIYVESFTNILKKAVDVRVNNQLHLCKNCLNNLAITTCNHSSLGVLFSGGLDSIVLAVLADQCLKSNSSIDLLNVSFEHKITNNEAKNRRGSASVIKTFHSPDRLTGIKGYEELKRICPNRRWNFVQIDVTSEELQNARENQIRYLIHPLETVLDDSVGCATWFATKGVGTLRNECGESVSYTSPSRVVLLGMGADEQLGGYSRHRQKYLSGGWKELIREMSMEINRISVRNLGRDDRIISDLGREARFPYLDENVVGLLSSMPVHVKLNLELPRGLGEKLLLRMVAYNLNLKRPSVLPKRAIQFGSRIANAEGKEKGSDFCKRL